MECVAYLRVSTEKQAEEGHGLDSQKRDIENYVRKNELIVTDWYIDDGYTGANMDRPELKRLINDCMRKKIKLVVAFKLDRISRSMVDGIYIIEKILQPNGVTLKCVHDTVNYDSPMEQAYTQMMAVFAQLDKNTMLLRMRGGMLERIKQGYWSGGGNLPYCYSYDKEKGILVPIPERAEQARSALDLFIQGYPDVKIQHMLGFKTEITVRSVLTGIVNIGMIPYKGKVYQGLHEPIFDKQKYELALELRKARRRNKYTLSANLLTGLCYCGVCGCKMRYQKWHNGTHKIYCYSRNSSKMYLPNHNSNCTNGLINAEEIERKVEKQILQISMNIPKDYKSQKVNKIELLESQRDKEKVKLKRLYELYSEGNDTVISMIKEKETEINKINNEISEVIKENKNKPKENFTFDNIKKLADVWNDLDKPDKNKILKTIISKIVIVNNDVDILLNI